MNKWLLKDKEQLGVEGGKYDFAALDMVAMESNYAAAAAEKSVKGKTVNRAVMSSFERAEAEYKSLVERRRIVLKDRDTIVEVLCPTIVA